MPKVIDSEQYRKELLHKSFDLLASKGYANVTTRQLSKELGISTGAMYHYFPSKKALFEQLVEEMSQQDEAMLRVATQGTQSLPERIAALGQFLIDHEDYFVKQTAIWTDFCKQTDTQEILNNPIFQSVDEQYRRAIASTLQLSDPKVSHFVWTLVNGMLIEQVWSVDSLAFADQVNLLVKMLNAYFEKYPG